MTAEVLRTRIASKQSKHSQLRSMPSCQLVSIIGVGVALWRGNVRIHNDLNSVKRDIADLRERMARLEGLFEGFTKRSPIGDAD